MPLRPNGSKAHLPEVVPSGKMAQVKNILRNWAVSKWRGWSKILTCQGVRQHMEDIVQNERLLEHFVQIVWRVDLLRIQFLIIIILFHIF